MTSDTNPDTASALTDLDRLTELTRYDLTNPRLRAELDEAATRTAEHLGQPVSLVTVLLDSAQLFIGGHGVSGWPAEAGGMPAEWAFCAQMVRTGKPYIVPDLTRDPLQRDNPIVTQVGIRSYAGVPLVGDNGKVIGGHCVLGAQPHHYSDDELEALHEATGNIMQTLRRYRIEATTAGD
ncbi:GAF domain-containing protein [Dactylosporangium vinaceum]|uniref:GAF domain-containing protein n=1 Tax=Dactylosporangium vinaceum TaxID=53362 RepID=A0ABV5MSC3_9ACTN|nr:GAF domain-containing protein [Dactylosporangium vinaceum]UAC00176.1 GAF domain-containing protein [Dactylosporangium vinaceum]